MKNKSVNEKSLAEKLLVEEVVKDFKTRQAEKKSFELQWQLNMNFLVGNQYCDVLKNGTISDYEKKYFWQSREVYNHIAPIVETRLSKLQRVRPKMNVFPASTDEKDVQTAKVSKKIVDAIYNKSDMSKIIREVTKWSEVCGSGFYKIVWNNIKGNVIAKFDNGIPLYEGDIEILPVSPFEIFPESNTISDIKSSRSIIHARAYHVDEIKNLWGVDVDSEKINVYSLDKFHNGSLGSNTKVMKTLKKNYATVIERYEAPSVKFPNGRLVIVAGDKLVFVGELPYINGENGERCFPFVKQDSIPQIGCFWGISIIERLIPLQRSYNAIKNRKHEFVNRLSMGVLTVEDGSVDLDELEEEGLCPGKVVVYRQGATSPSYMKNDSVPYDFSADEKSLQEEFEKISGTSDMVASLYSQNLSGVALERMIEEDENRFLVTSDAIKIAIKEVAKQILRLYKQYTKIPKLMKLIGDNGDMELFYFNSSDITSDDVVFETKNEISDSFSQRRSVLFDLIEKGILTDKNGNLSNKMKLKITELLGFGIWENSQDISELHQKKALKENLGFLNGVEQKICEIDDDEIHIEKHTIFMLSEEFEKSKINNKNIEDKILKHILEHKNKLNKNKIN